MKRFLILLVFLIILTSAGVFSFLWWNGNTKSVSSDEAEIRFVVPKGRTATQIANSLYEKGLIKNPLAFKFYVQLTGASKKIQAGEFSLSANMDMYEILESLFKGPIELWVTIPEGLRRQQMAEIFIEKLEMSMAQATLFREEFLSQSEDLEGYLFPDTYLFPKDATASLVIAKMRAIFDSKITEEMRQKVDLSGYSMDEIVALASIIERETKTKNERPIVAGILYKRLESSWPIQADASVQYAIGNINCGLKSMGCDDWWPILTLADLEIDSSYNSYKYLGLPPTPIANPGLSSLQAAIEPEESEYWYYIHDSEAQIHFAKTLEEHNGNIRKYLQ